MTFEDIASLQVWFNENFVCIIEPYCFQNTGCDESYEYQIGFMEKHLYFAKKIIEDASYLNSQKIDLYMKNLMHKDGGGGKIVLVDGAKGGGKTGFGCWTLDEYHKQKPNLKYYFVTKAVHRPELPDWVIVVDNIDKVPNDCIAVVDEGAIQLSNRRSMTKENRDASDRLVTLRHRGITLIILVQNIKMVDTNVRRLADIRILKFGIPFGTEEQESDDIKEIRKRLRPQNNKDAYMEISAYHKYFRFKHDLPEWFNSETTSKSFKVMPIIKQQEYKKPKKIPYVPYISI